VTREPVTLARLGGSVAPSLDDPVPRRR
jgi:hypothetical protein